MAWEFYDPRREPQDLRRGVAAALSRHKDEDVLPYPEVLCRPGEVAASDDAPRIWLDTPELPLHLMDDDVSESFPMWRRWLAFLADAVTAETPLWAGFSFIGHVPTLSELRDDSLVDDLCVLDLWVCSELGHALSGVDLRSCLRRELAGGLWISATERELHKGPVLDEADHERDRHSIRRSLLAATDHLLPARDAPPYVPPPPLPPQKEAWVDVVVALWSPGRSAAELYAQLGYAFVGRGANPVESYAWEDALPLERADAFNVVLAKNDPHLVLLEALLQVDLPWRPEQEPGMEETHRWLVEVCAEARVAYAVLDLGDHVQVPSAPGYNTYDEDSGEVTNGPYSFAVDRAWLGLMSFERVEQLLHGAWRYDVGTVTGWWLRAGDPWGDERWDRALEVANLIRTRARQS